jgi:aquaporin Z
MAKYLTEFVGTFLLVFVIALSVVMAGSLAPVAIGVALIALVYMGGHVSGAQYNPAVAVATLMLGKLSFKDFLPYVACQIAGAAAAAAIAAVITGQSFAPAPGKDVAWTTSLLVEFFFTFMLVLVILNVAVHPKTKGNGFYGAAIGLTVMAGAFAGGGISGGAFNPAVALGPMVVDAIKGGSSIGNAWLYLVGPIGGALAAAGVYKVMESVKSE